MLIRTGFASRWPDREKYLGTAEQGREGVAKLRLLIVEPWARGSGLGRRLVDEVIGFAKEAGYRKLTLWTQQNLEAARRIYAAAGFRKTHEEPYTGIGRDLVSETWDLDL